ncbi:MAG: polyprenol monophosphomannose synthase [Bacteroidales bacterium]|nr:polyprenol monophosphomannose synthase [Candidatus Egerieousia equi]
MAESLIIIPTYNERANIQKIITRILSYPQDFDVLVIDDNSPDGTAALVKEMQRTEESLGSYNQDGDSQPFKVVEVHRRINMIERSGKLGLGTAYITGFKWALERDYRYIFEMDADFSHNPDDLPRLLDAVKGNSDVAIGSRYCNGISVVNWPIGRVIMSYYASTYVRKMLGMRIFDCTAGFVCYRREVLQTIDFDRIAMHGYGFQIEMKYNAYKLGFKIAEVPVIFVDRKEGSSKMSSGIFGEAFWGVIALRFRRIKGR